MAYRFREQYQAVLGKRRQLREANAYSVPDDVGTRVAILVPFIQELVYEEEDSQANFEKQTDELMTHYAQHERDPYYVMGATPADFEDTLTDRSVPTVVVSGFGNFSATAVPFSKDRRQDARFGYLDWQHLAGMSTHLKLGKFVMYTCGGFYREFNPPLASGVVSSYRNILAPIGLGIKAVGMQVNEPLIQPVTTKDELDYEEIKRLYPLQRERVVPPVVPDPAYVAVRGLYNRYLNRELQEKPRAESIPYPDLRQYL
jgi:hypothetical protein